jgi:hypothetical protein
MRRSGVFAVTLTLVAGIGVAPVMAQEKLTLGIAGAT